MLVVENRGTSEPPRPVGYAAIFSEQTELAPGVFEVVKPGAFTNSLKRGDDVRALFNHESDLIVGRTAAGTLRLSEDAKGLRVAIAPANNANGWNVVESVQRGDVSQMSFGFYVIRDEWTYNADGTILRTLVEVELFDVSPVTFPAYPTTTIAVDTRDAKRTAPNPQAPPADSRTITATTDQNTVMPDESLWDHCVRTNPGLAMKFLVHAISGEPTYGQQLDRRRRDKIEKLRVEVANGDSRHRIKMARIAAGLATA